MSWWETGARKDMIGDGPADAIRPLVKGDPAAQLARLGAAMRARKLLASDQRLVATFEDDSAIAEADASSSADAETILATIAAQYRERFDREPTPGEIAATWTFAARPALAEPLLLTVEIEG